MAANGPSLPPFSKPRALMGSLLLAVGSFLMLIDAFTPEYQVDIAALALAFGTGGVLLGVEGIRKFFG